MNIIKKGNVVTVTNEDYCYSRYSRFAYLHPWYALRWAYGHHPRKGHYYRVLGVYKDLVVIQDTQCDTKKMNPIYFMDIRGLKIGT